LGWLKISFRHLFGAGEDGGDGRDQAVIDIEITYPVFSDDVGVSAPLERGNEG